MLSKARFMSDILHLCYATSSNLVYEFSDVPHFWLTVMFCYPRRYD